MEALLYAFLAFASVFVLVVSSVLFFGGKKALFKDRAPTLVETVVLFGVSIFASVMLGVLLMFVFDIR